MNFDELPLTNNTTTHSFELKIDNYTAFVAYRQREDKIYLVHTEVPQALEGTGAANAIVEKTLNYIEQQGLKLIPLCPYVATYLKRHPEWTRILA